MYFGSSVKKCPYSGAGNKVDWGKRFCYDYPMSKTNNSTNLIKFDIDQEYQYAYEHYLNHNCGGKPYMNYNGLFQLMLDLKPKNILEIGTAIGFTAKVIKQACPDCILDTIDMNQEHIELASENLKSYAGVNLILGDAKQVMTDLKDNYYDVIFFDGYSPRHLLLEHFERIIATGGYLITANCHLRGPTDGTKQIYMDNINDATKWQKIEFQQSQNLESDTIMHQKV